MADEHRISGWKAWKWCLVWASIVYIWAAFMKTGCSLDVDADVGAITVRGGQLAVGVVMTQVSHDESILSRTSESDPNVCILP